MRLRPYKNCDVSKILSWIKDETSFRKWGADRYKNYPATPEDMNKMYKEVQVTEKKCFFFL
ncbi:hypothetical protein [Treponema berlinense]|uniref:hypothetical protein n=1 Tax=Treponema berlinense TaxID=225004 RepID=UPI003FD6CEFD